MNKNTYSKSSSHAQNFQKALSNLNSERRFKGKSNNIKTTAIYKVEQTIDDQTTDIAKAQQVKFEQS